MKVGFLGPKGTFSYEICNKIYNNSIKKIPYKTIKETILALEKDEVEEIVIPIENSLQGCVTETVDTLIEIADTNIEIEAEYTLKINQNLMAKEDYKLDQIKEIYSHPQALAQCRNYIQKNLKNATIIEVSSTAFSAERVKEKPFAACICSIECLKDYKLKLLEANIQDNDLNETRFWKLNKKKKDIINANMVSLLITTKHESGALYKALSFFNKHHLNLTKIESRPAKTKLGVYYFLIDLEINSEKDKKTLEKLKNQVNFYRVLGIYRRGE